MSVPSHRVSSEHRVDGASPPQPPPFSPASGERHDGADGFFFYFLIYCVFVEERVSPPFLVLERLLCRSAAVSVTSNPGKTKKKSRRKQHWCLHICHPPVTTLSSFLQMVVLPRARSSSRPAAQNQREVLRCCRWNAAVFVSVLRCVVLVPVFSFRLRCPVLTDYELYKATRGCSSIDPGSDDQKCRFCRGVI